MATSLKFNILNELLIWKLLQHIKHRKSFTPKAHSSSLQYCSQKEIILSNIKKRQDREVTVGIPVEVQQPLPFAGLVCQLLDWYKVPKSHLSIPILVNGTLIMKTSFKTRQSFTFQETISVILSLISLNSLFIAGHSMSGCVLPAVKGQFGETRLKITEIVSLRVKVCIINLKNVWVFFKLNTVGMPSDGNFISCLDVFHILIFSQWAKLQWMCMTSLFVGTENQPLVPVLNS